MFYFHEYCFYLMFLDALVYVGHGRVGSIMWSGFVSSPTYKLIFIIILFYLDSYFGLLKFLLIVGLLQYNFYIVQSFLVMLFVYLLDGILFKHAYC